MSNKSYPDYNQNLTNQARFLRKNSTLSEVLLWQQLKGRQLFGYKFIRQKMIEKYIVDFYCPELKMIIEVDGIGHDFKMEYDQVREERLQKLGFTTLHFNDREVKKDVQNVIQNITDGIQKIKDVRGTRTPPTPPSRGDLGVSPKSGKLIRVAIIGGGTGTIAVLSGLKKYSDLDLSVIVSMTDDGGSNAVIRDEFGLLPLSDLRKSIIALAETDNKVLRELFTYRFSKGNGLSGHTLGNLMMMALADTTGSELEAVKAASRLFNVRGQVIPVTLETTELVAEYQSGAKVHSEHLIDEPLTFDPEDRIVKLHVEPEVPATKEALDALTSADAIIAGPGDLYTTTLANIVIDGIPQAIQQSKGKFIFITNLMTKKGQTHWMNISDQVKEVTTYVGRKPDVVIVHSEGFDPQIVQKYTEQQERPMIDDLGNENSFEVIRADVVNHSEVVGQAGDTLARSLIRHDAEKLGEILRKIILS